MSLKVLIVDDATMIRDMVKKQLRDRIPGVEVFEAPDGVRALVVIKHNAIDMILSEWEMPLMSGEELLRQVRTMADYGKVPFVMITSRVDRVHVVKAIQAGVSDYLTKPFTPEELLKKVFHQLKAIGKLPPAVVPPTKGTTQGIASASVGVLTNTKPAPVAKPAAAAKPVAAPSGAKSKAQLRLPENRLSACIVREISPQMVSLLMPRSEHLPRVFDVIAIEIGMGEGVPPVRINTYLHSISAGENRADTTVIKVILRFTDADKEKLDALAACCEPAN